VIALVLGLLVLACVFGLVVGLAVLAEPTPEQKRREQQARGLDLRARIR